PRARRPPRLPGALARSHSSADGRADVACADRVRGLGRPSDQDAVEAVDVAPAPGVAVGDRLRSGPLAVRGRECAPLGRCAGYEWTVDINGGLGGIRNRATAERGEEDDACEHEQDSA